MNGLGGIGKSAVASKYASQWKERYRDGVFHFNAESYSSLHNSVRENVSRFEFLSIHVGSLLSLLDSARCVVCHCILLEAP